MLIINFIISYLGKHITVDKQTVTLIWAKNQRRKSTWQ